MKILVLTLFWFMVMNNYTFFRDTELLIGVRNGGGIAYKNQDVYGNRLVRNNLNISFNISKSIRNEESTGSISIHNVNYETYKFLTTETENLQVILRVGHEGLQNKSKIFHADIIDMDFQKQQAGTVLNIEAKEGLHVDKVGVLRKSYPPNTLLTDIIKDCESIITSLGLDSLEIFKIFNTMDKDILGSQKLANGYTANMNVLGVLRFLLNQYGYYIYYNNNRLIIAHPDAKIEGDRGWYFDHKHGLLGSPKLLKGGKIKFNALINPFVTLGSRVKVKTDSFSKNFIVSQISYNGDNHLGDYTMSIEGI